MTTPDNGFRKILDHPRSRSAFLILFGIGIAAGCAAPYAPIDRSLAAQARLALLQQRPPPGHEQEDEENVQPYRPPEAATKSVFLGELVAIFPGFFWHGLGHDYAGDHRTAKEIRTAGEWGYLLLAIGGGMGIGGYFVDKSGDEWEPYAISLYVAGGITGGVGAGFFLVSWFYDMIDTPRAIESGGRPPTSGPFRPKDEERKEP